jgi:peptidoglycan hydrolase-like protein with peptidoglycan-binding domain
VRSTVNLKRLESASPSVDGRSLRAFWIHLAPLIVLWTVPVAALAILLPLSNQTEQQGLDAPLAATVTVGERLDSQRQSVTIEVDLGEAPAVRSPASGVITEVSTLDGALSNGAPLVRVNDMPVVAMISEVPLYRDLQFGDRGNDVRSLGQFLAAIGQMPANQVGDQYGSALRVAVRKFQASIGVRQDGVFKVTYVAFAPTTLGPVTPAGIEVGDQISAGTIMYTAARMPLKLKVLNSAGTTPLTSGQSVVLSNAADDDVTIESFEPTGDELSEIYTWLQSEIASGALQSATTEDTLTVTGAMLELADPEHVGTVPSTAIYVSEAGAKCVFVPVEDGFDALSLSRAESAPGEIGVSYVDSSLAGTEVVRDPLRLTRVVRSGCA